VFRFRIGFFFLFLWAIFALLDPGIRVQPTKINADPSGFEPESETPWVLVLSMGEQNQILLLS
jgi:hypothetical protein